MINKFFRFFFCFVCLKAAQAIITRRPIRTFHDAFFLYFFISDLIFLSESGTLRNELLKLLIYGNYYAITSYFWKINKKKTIKILRKQIKSINIKKSSLQ